MKKAPQARSKVKTMLIPLFDTEGIMHSEFVHQGPTVNQNFHIKVSQHLCETVRRKDW